MAWLTTVRIKRLSWEKKKWGQENREKGENKKGESSWLLSPNLNILCQHLPDLTHFRSSLTTGSSMLCWTFSHVAWTCFLLIWSSNSGSMTAQTVMHFTCVWILKHMNACSCLCLLECSFFPACSFWACARHAHSTQWTPRCLNTSKNVDGDLQKSTHKLIELVNGEVWRRNSGQVSRSAE